MARFALVKTCCGRFLFTQFFDFSLMNDTHLHRSDGECEHYTLVINAQHANFIVRVFIMAQGHQRVVQEVLREKNLPSFALTKSNNGLVRRVSSSL